jgi:hypothetical protein
MPFGVGKLNTSCDVLTKSHIKILGPVGIFAVSCALLNSMEIQGEVDASRGEQVPPNERRALVTFLKAAYVE